MQPVLSRKPALGSCRVVMYIMSLMMALDFSCLKLCRIPAQDDHFQAAHSYWSYKTWQDAVLAQYCAAGFLASEQVVKSAETELLNMFIQEA